MLQNFNLDDLRIIVDVLIKKGVPSDVPISSLSHESIKIHDIDFRDGGSLLEDNNKIDDMEQILDMSLLEIKGLLLEALAA